MKTTNQSVLDWVEKCVALTKPDKILWIDGSQEQADILRKEGMSTGEMIALNKEKLPGCFLHRSDPDDVARVEDRTFICCSKARRRGTKNNCSNHKERTLRSKLV
jgi:phosphoenolpyruvate carboxykinase (GTP)